MSPSKQNSPDTYTVRVYTSRLFFPLWYFTHAHIVTEHTGTVNRYGLSGHLSPSHPKSIGGYVFKNFLPPTTGLFIIAAKNPGSGIGPRWKAKLEGEAIGTEGSPAHSLYSFIESDKLAAYPYKETYKMLGGPNSNTFVQWVINQVPEAKLRLPRSAHGKNFLN